MENGYSICLNKWVLDNKIKNELRLLLIISSLCAKTGYCWATNEYLADILDITDVSVSMKIKKLEKNGYIEVEYTKRGCEVISREIRLKNILIDDLKKFEPTVKKNFKDININDNNINNNKKENIKRKIFKKPTIEEINEYCKERNNGIDAEAFYDFYESKDWYVGKNKMKDWKACVRTWEKRNKPKEEKLPEWWNKTNEDFEEDITEDERREYEAIKNGTYKP